MEGLKTLTNLTSLELYENKIRKIRGISALVNLTSLDLSYNRIKAIEGLETLVNLRDLYIASNRIERMEGLGSLKKLRRLDLGMNGIRVGEAVPSRLNSLHYSTHVFDHDLFLFRQVIEGLSGCPELEELWLGKNKIEKIPVSSLISIPITGHENMTLIILMDPIVIIMTWNTLYRTCRWCRSSSAWTFRATV